MKNLLAFLTLLVYLPTIAVASHLGTGQNLGDIPGTNFNFFELVFGAELPADFLTTEKVLQFLFFPFLAVVFVMYGILSELRIFRRMTWVNGVLALFIALMASSSGALLIFTRVVIGVGGGFAGTIMFAVLLIVGIFLWGASRLWGWGFRRAGTYGKIIGAARESFALQAQEDRIREAIKNLEILSPYPYHQIEELRKRLDELDKERIKRTDIVAEEEKKKAKDEAPYIG